MLKKFLKLRYKVMFISAFCVLFFLIPELGLRIYVKMASKSAIASYEWINPKLKLDILEDDYLAPDPLLYWKLRPRKAGFAPVNSLGTRGKEFSKNKNRGIFRIVCLGDSSTYGAYIYDDNNTYCNILEKMLNSGRKSLKRYEVINAGVPGYGSYQGLLYLQRNIVSWHPDLVTVYLGNNNDAAINRYFDLHPPVDYPLFARLNNLLDHSYLYNLLKSALLKLKVHILIKTDRSFPVAYRKSKYELAKIHFLKMFNIARKNGFKIIFLNYPLNNNMLGRDSQMNRVIREAAQEADVPVVDLIRAFKANGQERLFIDDMHPNIQGHKVIAGAIYKTILDEGIVN